MIRAGNVSSVNPQNGTVRVAFPDNSNLLSGELPVIISKSKWAKTAAMPSVGDPVLCLFLSNGIQNGFCLGSFYNDLETPPPESDSKRGVFFEDGSYAFYDRQTGSMHIKATNGLIIEGNVTVNGTLTYGGGGS
ncbi:phage baseplate assembly protein V [Paenibacillus anseongense]|uniref:phage baseplate assembly protein V n=1 Tax=Paenibacillus anseongense TaxID=2682845 RepID=UPI002DBE67D4|nr:phage baseplate assembly protein V [Paenibacillus anseongense]MEC0269053.1 phage baseplate assembly protein V [Paenibacillus anseongense]